MAVQTDVDHQETFLGSTIGFYERWTNHNCSQTMANWNPNVLHCPQFMKDKLSETGNVDCVDYNGAHWKLCELVQAGSMEDGENVFVFKLCQTVTQTF